MSEYTLRLMEGVSGEPIELARITVTDDGITVDPKQPLGENAEMIADAVRDAENAEARRDALRLAFRGSMVWVEGVDSSE